MFSTFAELAGMACLVEGADALLGRGAAFIVAGLSLFLIALAVNDDAVTVRLRRTVRSLTRSTKRPGAAQRSDSPHPPIEVDPVSDEVARELAEQVLRRQSGERRMSAVQ